MTGSLYRRFSCRLITPPHRASLSPRGHRLFCRYRWRAPLPRVPGCRLPLPRYRCRNLSHSTGCRAYLDAAARFVLRCRTRISSPPQFTNTWRATPEHLLDNACLHAWRMPAARLLAAAYSAAARRIGSVYCRTFACCVYSHSLVLTPAACVAFSRFGLTRRPYAGVLLHTCTCRAPVTRATPHFRTRVRRYTHLRAYLTLHLLPYALPSRARAATAPAMLPPPQLITLLGLRVHYPTYTLPAHLRCFMMNEPHTWWWSVEFGR